MAYLTPTHTCGHETRVQTLAPVSQRYDLETKLSAQPCKACREKTATPETHTHTAKGKWCRRCGGPVADSSGFCGEC